MRNLVDYILEAKIGNLGITLDDLIKYVDTVVLINGAVKDYTVHSKIRNICISRFGENQGSHIFHVFGRYVEFFIDTIAEYTDITDDIIRLLYEKLEDIDLRKVEGILGSGMEATTIELGKDKVIKLYFNKKVPRDRVPFFEMCKKRVCEHFPVVYRIGKGYVVMEKLKVGTDHCKAVYNALYHRKGDQMIYHLIQDDMIHRIKSKFTPIELEAIKFMEAIRPYLDELGFDRGYYGDLGLDNIGEREDGTIVYFDI